MADISIVRGENEIVVNVKGHAPIVVAYGRLTNELRDTAMRHGLGQKLGDAGAKSRNPDTGASATTLEKYNAIKAVADNLLNGAWNFATREGGIGAATEEKVGILAKMFGRETSDIWGWIGTRSKEQLVAAFSSPKFVLELAKHRVDVAQTPEGAFDGLDDVVMADGVVEVKGSKRK